MATRGNMGGLAVAVADVLIVLAAMRWDVIILESVGVGQNEVDIGMYADTVVVLQSAHGGDEIQMTKAGLLEIGDIFVVNKCDDPNTARMTSALREMVHRAHAADVFAEWLPPVIETQANIDSGIDSLMTAIDARATFIAAHPEVPLKRERAQVIARIEAAILDGFRTISHNMNREMQSLTDDIVARRTDPYVLAGSIVKRILGTIVRV
jgi:LAO/AO transport system kinase